MVPDFEPRKNAKYPEIPRSVPLQPLKSTHSIPRRSEKIKVNRGKGAAVTFGSKRRGLRMIVKYLTAQQRLALGHREQAKTGFYWQAEVDDPWIGPFETLEE